MPQFLSFHLKNFKGAKNVDLDMCRDVKASIITLVGLNESGKTTILEGISCFTTSDATVSSIFNRLLSKETIANLVPLDKKPSFNEAISLEAWISFEADDFHCLEELYKKHGLEMDLSNLGEKLKITKRFNFVNSEYASTKNTWDLVTYVRPLGSAEAFKRYLRPDNKDEDLWLIASDLIEAKIPVIAYFPTFIVDMPSRIYLSEHAAETPLNRYYREIIKEILKNSNPPIDLRGQIIDRVSSYKASDKDNPQWISDFLSTPAKSVIDAIFQKMASSITLEVIGSWSKILKRPSGARSILVEWGIDPKREGIPYLSFFVSDGASRFQVSDRSLGFRWFFSFLLFTAFRSTAERKTLFLFDEPAANLHAGAQAELLESFDKICAGGNQIIYSTHSHHMISPRWLSAAYIIENSALDFGSSVSFELDIKATNILAIKYRKFVSQSPNRTNYYQPIIDQLQYVAPEIIGSPPFLVVEGITDYYALRTVSVFSTKLGFSIIPGSGAGASAPLISYLLGLGIKFLVLLDDDKAGRVAADKYRDMFYLGENNIKTLSELDPAFDGKKLESILSTETKKNVAFRLGSQKAPTKKQIGLILAEMCQTPSIVNDVLSSESRSALQKVLDLTNEQLLEGP